MSNMIINDLLRGLYYQETQRQFVVVDDGQCLNVFYSQHTPLINDARDYLINNKELLNGKYYGLAVNVARKSQTDIDAYFSGLMEEEKKEEQLSVEDRQTITHKLKALLQKAVHMGVSDVHIEIYERSTLVKFRVDGKRQLIQEVPENSYGMRIASVIFMSKAGDKETDFKRHKVNNGNLSEDLSVKGSNRNTSWRCAWLPAVNGGKITLRWTDKHTSPPSLAELNWEPRHIELAQEFINGRPGVFVMAGETGSGKTTTIASMIESIDKSYSIHTLEDPPEFDLKGVIQTHIKPHEKLDDDSGEHLDQAYFSKALLRHDTDYELHGETRTKAAAMQVCRKGATGQKVFTTIHTSDPIGIPITFIEQFGLSPSLVASPKLLRYLVYQALVRKLCPSCSKTLEQLQDLSLLSEERLEYAINTIEQLRKTGAVTKAQAGNIRFRNPNGCEHCDAGESDRLPLVEMLVVGKKDLEFIKRCDYLGWRDYLDGLGYKTVYDHAVTRIKRGEVDLFTVESKIGKLFEQNAESVYGGILDECSA